MDRGRRTPWWCLVGDQRQKRLGSRSLGLLARRPSRRSTILTLIGPSLIIDKTQKSRRSRPHLQDGPRSESLIRNDAPPWTRFFADISPLCASIMVRAMDSPMPMPSALLVKNGSKIPFNLSSGTPVPRSDTDSWAKCSTRAVRMLMMRLLALARGSSNDPGDVGANRSNFHYGLVPRGRSALLANLGQTFVYRPPTRSEGVDLSFSQTIVPYQVDDLRDLPLIERKRRLARLLGRTSGIPSGSPNT